MIGYYDAEDQQYYDVNKQPVDYLNVDAATGWTIVRNFDAKVVGYYDTRTGQYYDTAKLLVGDSLTDPEHKDYTVIIDKFGHILWYKHKTTANRYLNPLAVRVNRDKDAATGWWNLYKERTGAVVGYYDEETGLYYQTDKTTLTSFKEIYATKS